VEHVKVSWIVLRKMKMLYSGKTRLAIQVGFRVKFEVDFKGNIRRKHNVSFLIKYNA